jgi:hypothetical protein
MSRFFARSVSADILARILNAVLFVLLLPFILIRSRRIPPGPTRTVPYSVSLPRDRLSEPS